MEYILNPYTGERLSIFSSNGKTVLQNYLKAYMAGGSSVDSDEMEKIDWDEDTFFSTDTPRNTPLPPSPPTFDEAARFAAEYPVSGRFPGMGNMTTEYADKVIDYVNREYIQALHRWPEYMDKLSTKDKYMYTRKYPDKDPHQLIKLLSLCHAKYDFFYNYLGLQLVGDFTVDEDGVPAPLDPESLLQYMRGGMKRKLSDAEIYSDNPFTVGEIENLGETKLLSPETQEQLKILKAYKLRFINQMMDTHIDEVPSLPPRKSRRLALKKNKKTQKKLSL